MRRIGTHLDGHNRHTPHQRADRKVNHRVLGSMRRDHLVDHIQRKDSDYGEIHQKGGLGGVCQDFIDGFDFFIGWSVEDDYEGSDLGDQRRVSQATKACRDLGRMTRRQRTERERKRLTIQDAHPQTPNLPNFSSSKNEAKIALSGSALSSQSRRLCEHSALVSIEIEDVPDDNTHGS